MKRLEQADLSELLRCVECGSEELTHQEGAFRCAKCGVHFPNFRDVSVMFRGDNSLFPPEAYRDEIAKPEQAHAKRSLGARIKSAVPSRSMNLARDRMFGVLEKDHNRQDKTILVIGCGQQDAQLAKRFTDDSTCFVFCDVDKSATADLFCDGHDLPFKDGVFDGVISTAVMEHVLWPDRVASEIHRVLRCDGFVYSEIPFLQGVHEGAYDFTRFSLSGHRRLYEYFNEIDAGMVAGPGPIWFGKSWMFSDTCRLTARFQLRLA